MNRLYLGDNLKWLSDRKEFPDTSVDLVYLDPPFNSNADYNVLFREPSGQVSQAQFHAFTDTRSWADAADTYHQFIDNCPNVAVVELMEALDSFLRTLLDGIFGNKNFINEISWKRTTTKSDFRQGAKNWPRIRDVIHHYAKESSKLATFNQPFGAYSEEYIDAKYHLQDPDGRRYMLDNLTAPGAGTRGHPQYEIFSV